MRSNLELIKECDSSGTLQFLPLYILNSPPHLTSPPPPQPKQTNQQTNIYLLSPHRFPYPGTPEHTALIPTLYTLLYTPSNTSTPIPIGYLPTPVHDALLSVPAAITGPLSSNSTSRTIEAFTQPTEPERSSAVAQTCTSWREQKTFAVLSGWRNELYPVYGPSPSHELLFNIERSASPLFGVVTYGVHMSCYTKLSPSEQAASNTSYNFKMWIPRRSRQKQTYGGLLDNTVAGGIASGESPFESLIREADEEASLPSTLVRSQTIAAGTVTYIYLRDSRAGGETNLVQPEVQYVYDLELPKDVVPQPKDGEVEEFYLWSVEKVKLALKEEIQIENTKRNLAESRDQLPIQRKMPTHPEIEVVFRTNSYTSTSRSVQILQEA
ncbi:hypothetical protein G7Y89_g4000 [Cudoniella acicularis]|uniref:Nudix hydrolase domain-containing protein n=1 Tax=Cudoniella acicularis TaxID=354080 RepID=A0A8H4RQB4_9HELO|nr:hypothetical protein G7Y89_g4000 [Cudoniella acicularis]